MFAESELVWNELQLESLIDSNDDENYPDAIFSQLHQSNKPTVGLVSPQKNIINASDLQLRGSPHKIMEVFKKPAYSALINRYQSVPHKPKTIQIKKLNILADPIKGRYSKFVNNAQEVSTEKETVSSFPDSKPLSNKSIVQKESSSAFFLTEAEANYDSDDNFKDEEKIDKAPLNIPKGGFAAALRGQITNNRNKNLKKNDPLLRGNNRKNGSSNYNSNNNKKQGKQINMPLKKTIKKAWDNAIVNSAQVSRNTRISKSLLSNVEKERAIANSMKNNNELLKKIASSGYGKKELPKVANINKKANNREEGRRTVTKQLIQGLRGKKSEPLVAQIWENNQSSKERDLEGSEENKGEAMFQDRFSLAGLDTISETLAERAKRLQKLEQRQKTEQQLMMLKRQQRLNASGTQSAPSQLPPPQPPSPSSRDQIEPSSLISKDDQHVVLPPIITTNKPAISSRNPIVASSTKRKETSVEPSLSSLREREKKEKEPPEKRWQQSRAEKQQKLAEQEQQQQQQQQQNQRRLEAGKVSITSLITRRIQKPLPDSHSPSREFPPPIPSQGEAEKDSLSHLPDDLLLQEIKKEMILMKSSPNFKEAAVSSPIASATENDEEILKEDRLQYEEIQQKAQQLKSEAAQQLANQIKKLGNHFNTAQKLSAQYKSTANEFGALPFLE